MTKVCLMEKDRIICLNVSTLEPITRIGEYSKFAHGLRDEKKYLYEGLNILQYDIFSVSEQIYLNIDVEISERLAREINRHRHIAIVQESTRYNNYLNDDKTILNYFIPKGLSKNGKEDLINYYQTILTSMNQIQNKYDLPIEQINYLLPLGKMTKVHYHINLRSLIHMFNIRTCRVALPEFKEFLLQLREKIKTISPEWFFIAYYHLVPQCQIPRLQKTLCIFINHGCEYKNKSINEKSFVEEYENNFKNKLEECLKLKNLYEQILNE